MRLSAGVVNALMNSMQSAGSRELADNKGRMQTSLHSSMPPLGGDNEGTMKKGKGGDTRKVVLLMSS